MRRGCQARRRRAPGVPPPAEDRKAAAGKNGTLGSKQEDVAKSDAGLRLRATAAQSTVVEKMLARLNKEQVKTGGVVVNGTMDNTGKVISDKAEVSGRLDNNGLVTTATVVNTSGTLKDSGTMTTEAHGDSRLVLRSIPGIPPRRSRQRRHSGCWYWLLCSPAAAESNSAAGQLLCLRCL